MSNHNLRKMNRKELLELLIALKEENDRLKEQVQQQAAQLENRDIQIGKAGTLAEASLMLNGVFEAADKAAEQYLANIRRYSEWQKSIYGQIVAEAKKKAEEILRNAENGRQQIMKAAAEDAQQEETKDDASVAEDKQQEETKDDASDAEDKQQEETKDDASDAEDKQQEETKDDASTDSVEP